MPRITSGHVPGSDCELWSLVQRLGEVKSTVNQVAQWLHEDVPSTPLAQEYRQTVLALVQQCQVLINVPVPSVIADAVACEQASILAARSKRNVRRLHAKVML